MGRGADGPRSGEAGIPPRDITRMGASVALLAVSAWVSVPLGPVPFTLQTMALAFVGIWFFSVTDKSQSASDEHAKFFPQFVRSQTGLGASGASAH